MPYLAHSLMSFSFNTLGNPLELLLLLFYNATKILCTSIFAQLYIHSLIVEYSHTDISLLLTDCLLTAKKGHGKMYFKN